MTRAAPLALLLLAGACGGRSTNEAIDREAQLAQEVARVQWSMNPCLIDEGDVLRSRRFRDCVELLPQERMHGLWYAKFEGSEYLPNATSAPRVRVVDIMVTHPGFDIELDGEAVWRMAGQPREPAAVQAVALDFLGRRSRYRGAYITGDDNYLVVVDQLISARLLGEVDSFVDCRRLPRVLEGLRCAPDAPYAPEVRSNAEPAQAVR